MQGIRQPKEDAGNKAALKTAQQNVATKKVVHVQAARKGVRCLEDIEQL